MHKGEPTEEEDTAALASDDADSELDLDGDFDADSADDPDAAIDLRAADVQCSEKEASIRRAIEERRESRRLKADLNDLDYDLDLDE